jgi:hypothetical protein
VLLVDRSELYRAVRPSCLGKLLSGGVALDVQELGHRVATEVAEAFEVFVGSRDGEIPRVVLDLDNLDDLSYGPSMYNCNCECWSVVPTAACGVEPLPSLPNDSAQS